MKKVFTVVVLVFLAVYFSGCAYWPETLKPKYFKQCVKDMKDDIDDSFGARDKM